MARAGQTPPPRGEMAPSTLAAAAAPSNVERVAAAAAGSVLWKIVTGDY